MDAVDKQKLITRATPFNAGELKVLEGTHGTKPMGLLGGEVGFEKHTKRQQKNKKRFFKTTKISLDG